MLYPLSYGRVPQSIRVAVDAATCGAKRASPTHAAHLPPTQLFGAPSWIHLKIVARRASPDAITAPPPCPLPTHKSAGLQ
jgi:hypothetical protein